MRYYCVVQIFCAPSFDDKILEVVAVFGSMQMAVSRVIKLQHHRIAQVRSQRKQYENKIHIRRRIRTPNLSLSAWISVEQWRLLSWVMREFPFRWTVRPGSNRLESSRSSTRIGLRCSPETEWVRRGEGKWSGAQWRAVGVWKVWRIKWTWVRRLSLGWESCW